MRTASRLLVVTAALLGAACRANQPLEVTTIQLGRSLNSDDSVGNHATTFKPDETVYTALINDAPGSGTITVRWMYAGQTVSEESRDVRFLREGATAFRLQAPSAGFPEGDYRLEVNVDGRPVGTRTFRVGR
jgi:hypothetical protein